jgi:hypothetical protein
MLCASASKVACRPAIWELVIGLQVSQKLRSLTSVARARTSGSHTRLHNARAHILNILRHTAHLCFIFCVHFAHSQKCINICRAASNTRVPRFAQAPRLRAWPRSQIQHGMLRAHMRERERRAWPRPLIWYNVRSIVCARLSLSLSLSLAPHPKKISKHAPPKNQKAFEYGTEAGSGSHLANQEASGAGKARAREVARTWPSYEMVRDTAQSFTRRCEMVRDTVTVQ